MGQPIAQGSTVAPLLDARDDTYDLSLNGIQLLSIGPDLLLPLFIGAVYFFVKGSSEFTNQLRGKELFLESSKNTPLDFQPTHCRAVAAGPFAAMCGAAVAISRDDGEPTPAAATPEQAG